MTLKWTRRQRAKLSLLRTPHKYDPPDFFPSAAEAWAMTWLDGDAASGADKALASAQWESDESRDALLAYWVETHGLVAACGLIRGVADASEWGVTPEWFVPLRRYFFRADEPTREEARATLLHDLEFSEFWEHQTIAFVLDDRDLALSLVEEAAGLHLRSRTRLLACLPAPEALKVVESSIGGVGHCPEVFDIVESLGAEAAPVLQALIGRWDGMASNRKVVEQAWKLAQSGAGKKAAPKLPGASSFVGWTAADAHEDSYTRGATVVVSGRFPGLSRALIAQRLRARGIRTRTGFGTKKDNTHALFAGEGAKKKLLDGAVERGVSVLGVAELSALLATPLFRYRERFEQIVQEALSQSSSEVHQWYIGAPATEEELEAAERTMGVPLDPALRSLYTQCNGLFLNAEYVKPSKDLKDQKVEPAAGSMPMFPCNPKASGRMAIAIPGLADLRAMGEDDPSLATSRTSLKVGKKSMKGAKFARCAFMLDYWYDFYPVAVVLDEASPGRVVYGDDHGATFETGDEATVEDYFESALMHYLSARSVGKARLSGPYA